jgi:hypothetical protein
MHGNSSHGPVFGACNDLYITSDGMSSNTNFSSYTDTLGQGDATFTGSRKFALEDYEVWAIT